MTCTSSDSSAPTCSWAGNLRKLLKVWLHFQLLHTGTASSMTEAVVTPTSALKLPQQTAQRKVNCALNQIVIYSPGGQSNAPTHEQSSCSPTGHSRLREGQLAVSHESLYRRAWQPQFDPPAFARPSSHGPSEIQTFSESKNSFPVTGVIYVLLHFTESYQYDMWWYYFCSFCTQECRQVTEKSCHDGIQWYLLCRQE